MTKDEKKKSNWRDKYRFSVVNDHTFEEVWRIRLTRYNAFLLTSLLLFFIIGGTATLISLTNIREFIPGYPDVTMRRNILMSAIRLDSLERQLDLRDKYFSNINAIIAGEQPGEAVTMQDTSSYRSIQYSTSPEESALRTQVENEEKYNVTMNPDIPVSATSLAELHFFPPVKGIVSGKFEVRTKHYGTDIVARPRSTVSAALDGTVIFTGWTMETGYVIEIQHPNNIVSIYKHNASLLKEIGDLVRA